MDKAHDEYLEIVYKIPMDQLEDIEQLLFHEGASSIERDPAQPEYIKVLVARSVQLPHVLDDYLVGYKRLDPKEWEHKWLDYYDGAALTPTVQVKPHPGQADESADITIFLDPASAFGDGRHPTTQLCAKALEHYLGAHQDPASLTLLDVGTGTGILSILAAKKGLQTVHAFDIDDDSVAKAQKNSELNGCTHIQVFQADVYHWACAEPYDVVVANVLTKVLLHRLNEILTWVKPGGYLVLSGVSEQHISEMESALRLTSHAFDTLRCDGWAGFTVTRSA